MSPLKVPAESISFFGGGGLTPKNFHEHEIMEIIDQGYVKLYETWGSNLFRFFKVTLNGYEYCRNHKRSIDTVKSKLLFKACSRGVSFVPSSASLCP